MMRITSRLFLATVLFAADVSARAVVVPAPPISEEAAAVFETRVTLANRSGSPVVVESRWWGGEGGSQVGTRSRSTVEAGGEIRATTPRDFRGLLELREDAALDYSARLVRRGDAGDAGPALPVLDAASFFRAGETAVLIGLEATGSIFTNLALVNATARESRCAVALATADGAPLGPMITMSVPARSSLPFLDAFEGRSPTGVAEGRAAVTCDGKFYAFALLADAASGRYEVVTPVAEATALALPAALTPCPTGATCFDADGVVHVPAPPPGKPVGRVSFPAPAGVANRLRLALDVTVADWYAKEPSGKALIYWFVVSKNIDMPGMLYFRGPGKDQAFARHGIGLKHPAKLKIIVPFKAQVGHTYHVDNDYDMALRKYTVKVTDKATGLVVATLAGRTNVASYTIKAAQKLLCDMGFYPDRVATEVPSYGWKYANVHIEAYMQKP